MAQYTIIKNRYNHSKLNYANFTTVRFTASQRPRTMAKFTIQIKLKKPFSMIVPEDFIVLYRQLGSSPTIRIGHTMGVMAPWEPLAPFNVVSVNGHPVPNTCKMFNSDSDCVGFEIKYGFSVSDFEIEIVS